MRLSKGTTGGLETKASSKGDELDNKWLLLSVDSGGDIDCSDAKNAATNQEEKESVDGEKERVVAQ